jgi:hypothetical protein
MTPPDSQEIAAASKVGGTFTDTDSLDGTT